MEVILADLSTHIFRVSLKPRLYRDIGIKSDESLAELAEVIVKAFDFKFDHAYGFFSAMKGNVYKSPVRYELFADVDGGREARSVKRTTVGDAFALVGSNMLFLFDYGDEWRFKIEVIGLGEQEPKGRYRNILATVGKAPDQYPDPDEDDWRHRRTVYSTMTFVTMTLPLTYDVLAPDGSEVRILLSAAGGHGPFPPVVVIVVAMVGAFSHWPVLRYRPAAPSFTAAVIMALTAFLKSRRLLPSESRERSWSSG
jgi:Plasmid pRiA4b ORF-3-like protein